MTATTKSPLPTEDPSRLTATEERDLARADAVLERTKNIGNKNAAKGAIAKIERARKGRADGAWRRQAMEETIDLARGRGEQVESVGGSVRISSRDGLLSLRQAGHLTETQYAVGMLYRAGHEARGRDLQAQTIGDSAGGGHDNDKFVASRIQRARMLDFTARADRAVACACISRPSALQMLRSVAGEGKSLSSWGEGRALARNRAALIEALDIAHTVAKTAQNAGSAQRANTTS